MTDTAIITGGAGGMGLATAEILGRDRRVVLSDVNQQALDAAVGRLQDAGVDATGIVCDIADRASVDSLFRRAAEHGRIGAVVHTAGLSPQMGSGESIMRVNAVGTVHVGQAALRIADEGFALVNIASIAGHMLPALAAPRRIYRLAVTDVDAFARRMVARTNRLPESMRANFAYTASKNFVIWYSREQAGRFGARGARILSVSPGSFDTAMGRLEERSGAGKLLDYAALKRFGKPEEVAELLAFCAGDRAGYLTGIDILCDGGTRAGLDLRGLIAIARGA